MICDSINYIFDEIIRQQKEHTERTLAEIITKYDFIVGSIECKHRLMEALPEGANIVCSPYIESPTMIYAIKKFDIMDLLIEADESKSEVTKALNEASDDLERIKKKYANCACPDNLYYIPLEEESEENKI